MQLDKDIQGEAVAFRGARGDAPRSELHAYGPAFVHVPYGTMLDQALVLPVSKPSAKRPAVTTRR